MPVSTVLPPPPRPLIEVEECYTVTRCCTCTAPHTPLPGTGGKQGAILSKGQTFIIQPHLGHWLLQCWAWEIGLREGRGVRSDPAELWDKIQSKGDQEPQFCQQYVLLGAITVRFWIMFHQVRVNVTVPYLEDNKPIWSDIIHQVWTLRVQTN